MRAVVHRPRTANRWRLQLWGVSHADHPCSMSTDMCPCLRLPHPKLAPFGMIPAGIYGGAEPINSCHRFDSELLRCKQIFDKEVKLDSALGGPWERHVFTHELWMFSHNLIHNNAAQPPLSSLIKWPNKTNQF